MKLIELYNHLAFSELSQLNLIDTTTYLVKEEHYDKVLYAIKLGLTALHTRFPLKEEELSIKLISGKYSYLIDKKHSIISDPTNGYILDTESNRYKNTLLKIERVINEIDIEYHLNNESDEYSIHTPNLNTINIHKDIVDKGSEVPEDLKAAELKIVYRANHVDLPIGYNGYDATQVEIDLPQSYVEALLYYVGSRIHNPLGMLNDFNSGNNYALKYERACVELDKNNLRVDQLNQNSRLHRNGWV